MSRTYRRFQIPLDCNCGAPPGSHWRYFLKGKFPTEEEMEEDIKDSIRTGIPPERICYCYTNRKYDYFSKRNFKRDRKPWYKSPGWYKKVRSRLRRARVKEAMANQRYDDIPRFRRENDWNWT